MAVKVRVTGVEATVSRLKEISKRAKPVTKRATYNMARRLKSYVRANLNVRNWSQGPRHNTPARLVRSLRGPEALTDGYRVFMDDGGRRVPLSKIVEFGTGPHEIPNNPIFGGGREFIDGGKPHPGARPKRYFRNAVAKLRRNDLKRMAAKAAVELVK